MRVIYYWSLLVLLVVAMASAEEQKTTGDEATPQEEKPATIPEEPAKPVKKGDGFDATHHTDWGTYYDPKNEFCGRFDCYKILGFDYESFGKEHPDKKVITQRYRALSREWHPDKSKHKNAKNRFVKIARAYEVLTSEETRKEYDFMRYNQEAYFKKYGSDVMWAYAPKSDTIMVVIFLLLAGSGISWLIQQKHWQNVADKLIKAAVEDWGSGQGGTPESKSLRERAVKKLQEEEEKAAETTNGNGESATSKKKKKVKLTASEKRKEQEESLRPIITELVNEMEDFGAGYHKPTWKDLLVVKLAQSPMTLGSGLMWNLKYAIRRLQKLELNDDEREVLTRRAVGEIHWVSATEDERKEMIMKDLWLPGNMVDWEEEQDMKQWSNTDRKRYMRMKKKGVKVGKEE
mmetsp:Transcript_15005/g.24815  ORF Transcript_15005/g.24815 Transcript_15005/m.24815 type:complete len:404 (-) Transcript_15005:119-1330(-)|eukprot:CAMPEP_0119012862 /NCGR_PEP_ID=MMETSP1176-20130426/7665_1 /TAXON_ID=265551 /ORGANISM="Synedropsis recta cf, Strain CCMP1620" /LENGTH=403 /DNA_ID=CAMNT_0006965897 /DNA_START=83 /DNA_END=1294 /DNA_ORIENTATION=+